MFRREWKAEIERIANLLRHSLFLIATVMLLAATLARPALWLERDTFRYVFAFDITQSMNVRDGPPGTRAAGDAATGLAKIDRLTWAKRAVAAVIGALPCESTAAIALFTGHRVFPLFTPVDVCSEYDELLQMVAKVDWQMAWAARSEVSKGLYQAIRLADTIGDNARLVFLTDGHEAPPVNAELRPRFRGEVGKINGLLVGVGGSQPQPIPKLDTNNKIIGYWQSDQVMQIDTYSQGRIGTSASNDPLSGADQTEIDRRIQSGTEHLSSLREEYLRELATETGLSYLRLTDISALSSALRTRELASPKNKLTDMRWLLAAIALVCLLLNYIDTRPWIAVARLRTRHSN